MNADQITGNPPLPHKEPETPSRWLDSTAQAKALGAVGLVCVLVFSLFLCWAVWQFTRKDPVVVAVLEGDIESLKRILDQGRVDVDHRYGDWWGEYGGDTLLHMAAERADREAVQLLLEHG